MKEYRKRALLSLTDKSGMVPFGRELEAYGFEIYSTGRTASGLRQEGVDVTDIADLTGFPEGMNGRIKTLHPKVFGGLLGNLDLENHVEFQTTHNIEPFQLVAVNLYAFAKAAADPEKTFDDVVEEIDVGGPSMVRAAAKNWKHCLIVVDPDDYSRVLEHIEANGTDFTREFRLEMMKKAFRMSRDYDTAICEYLEAHAA